MDISRPLLRIYALKSSRDWHLMAFKVQPNSRELIFACRMCNYSELATGSGLVYRNDLLTVTREQPGVTTDLGSDLTLVSPCVRAS